MANYPQQSAPQPLFQVVFLLGMGFAGLVLAGIIRPSFTDGAPPMLRYVGWAMVLLPVIRWRSIVHGLRQWGAVLVFVAVVALLAAVFSGEGGLWNRFF